MFPTPKVNFQLPLRARGGREELGIIGDMQMRMSVRGTVWVQVVEMKIALTLTSNLIRYLLKPIGTLSRTRKIHIKTHLGE